MKEFDEFRVTEESHIEKTFRFKPSASLLQQQTIFKRLVQLKKFKEAHQLREEFNAQEVSEHERFLQEKQKKIVLTCQKKMNEQAKERSALESKLQNEIKEAKKRRKNEQKQLRMRIENNIKELMAEQKLVVSRLDFQYQKVVQKNPRYVKKNPLKASMSESVMNTSMHSRVSRAASKRQSTANMSARAK